MKENKKALDTCGCCNFAQDQAENPEKNRPGLATLSYRIGSYAQFKEALKKAISRSRDLDGLTIRDDDDFSIALMDAWAVTADVLTFYQERIANEGYLGTAAERLSLSHLARLVGYKLNPGVAADAILAFTVEKTTGTGGQASQTGAKGQGGSSAPPMVAIDSGSKVQSVPGPDEKAQTFETVEKIDARAEWSAAKPRPSQPQVLKADMGSIILDGTAANLKAGDMVLLVVNSDASKTLKKILDISLDNESKTTRIDFAGPALSPAAYTRPSLSAGSIADFKDDEDMSKSVIEEIYQKTWKEEDLAALLKIKKWPVQELVTGISELQATKSKETAGGVFALRKTTAIFGHNAPKWDSLPASMRFDARIATYKSNGTLDKYEIVAAAYPNDWESHDLEDDASPANGQRYIFLDSTYPGIVEGSWIVLAAPSGVKKAFKVKENIEMTCSDFAISAKVSRLKVESNQAFDSAFMMRTTSVFGQSEELEVAEVPVEDLVEDDAITLDGIYPGLTIDRLVVVTGERDDLPGVYASEARKLKEIIVENGFSVITFDKALNYRYIRNTVAINANIAKATHGETVTEILGSGDSARVFQQFTLRQPPLTYISAANASGAESTLEVRVNDLLWEEVSSFYDRGPAERIFITGLDNAGKTYVMFGDGKTGSRLPTGQENIVATYRKGIGVEGSVAAGQLRTLMSRPYGVKEVTNSTAACGGADPESIAQSRLNIPLTVLTLERIVSLRDFEDFANAFAGIDKARADWIWEGETRLVYITIAGAKGKKVAEESSLYRNLQKAIKKSSNGRQPFRLGSFIGLDFHIEAKILVDAEYIEEKVLAAVKSTLNEVYSFAERKLAQTVYASEVMAVIQGVAGVKAVDLEKLSLTGEGTTFLNQYLPALSGRWDKVLKQSLPGQLLTLAANGLSITSMETQA